MEYIEKKQTGQTGLENNNYVRKQRLELRVSPDEYLKLEKLAIGIGYKTLASYVRETALEGPPLQGTKKLKFLERKKLISDFGRVGSNINQGLKIINQYLAANKTVDPEVLKAKFEEANFVEMKEDLKLIKQQLVKLSKK